MRDHMKFEPQTGHLEAVLQQVKADFVRRLDLQIEELESIRNGLGAPGKDDKLRDLEFISHKICGLAMTLGFSRLGRVSERVETTVASLPALRTAENLQELTDLIDGLVEEMEVVCEAGYR